MTHAPRDPTSESALAGVVVGLLLLVAVASLAAGSALQSSLSGGLPPYGATASEEARWAWGRALWAIGATLALGWAVLVVAIRRRIGLRLIPAVGVALGGIAVALSIAFVAWILFLA
ncbi:hypothetical protein [Microbacterium sp. TNHR37B]|uniref:hypothetical protein n=1 Tax=Microbacterium sp. TNHR37B TaxID=1775956 RepID=UPI0012F97D53|nr:hypothetical protein [Microbacterium sp. TNHR37B]